MIQACKQRVVRTLGLAIAMSLGTGASVAAQDLAVFAGTVFDEPSGRPLRRAVVSLPGLDRRATTGENGQFLIEGVPAGSYEVKFEAPGYVSVVERLDLSASDFLQIRLDPVAAVLDQILVLAGRSPTARPAGAVVEAAERQGPSLSALDLLQNQVPGVIVQRGGGLANGAAIVIRGVNSFRGETAPVIFVDDVRIDNAQTGFNSLHSLELIPAEMVSRIRVLKGASATGSFAMAANGVILIETIRGVGAQH